VAEVPGVLLHEVEQDPLEGGRVRAVPALAGLAHLVQRVSLDDGPAARGLRVQVGQQRGGRLVRADGPAAVLLVTPRIADVAALEAPLQPAQLDVAQVLDQFERRPAGWQPAAPLFPGRQRLHLGRQAGPEEVQVAQEDLGAGGGRGGGFGERLGHCASLDD
jgi:hypothetical protein